MKTILVGSVVVGERRRKKLGDLTGLMVSIQKHGLLHPIVVSDDRKLVAGQRRLEAYKRLGKKRIEVRFFGDLSDEERDELERDENVCREDLTAAELAEKRRVEPKEKYGGDRICSDAEQKRSPGRPKKGKNTVRERAKDLDVSPATVAAANKHAAACDRYPFLRGAEWSQRAALDMAKVLDEIGEADVNYLLGFCSNGYGGRPKILRKFFETWRQADPLVRKRLRSQLDKEPKGKSRTVSLMADCAPNPDDRLVWIGTVLAEGRRHLKKAPKDDLTESLEEFLGYAEEFQQTAREFNEHSIRKLKERLFS